MAVSNGNGTMGTATMSGGGSGPAANGNPRLVDTHTKMVHKLIPGAKHVVGKTGDGEYIASCGWREGVAGSVCVCLDCCAEREKRRGRKGEGGRERERDAGTAWTDEEGGTLKEGGFGFLAGTGTKQVKADWP